MSKTRLAAHAAGGGPNSNRLATINYQPPTLEKMCSTRYGVRKKFFIAISGMISASGTA
jgi:hypothetical protein